MLQEWLAALWSGTGFRQQRQRVVRYVDCTWESAWGVERSRISSISPTGCYIEDRLSVPAAGEQVRELTLTLPTGRVTLHGTVSDPTPGIGFAVRFTGIDADTRNRLIDFVQALRVEHPLSRR
jgi:hypothetical protein